jgi:hypothetical protein
VVPTLYAVTGLSAIGAAFVTVAVAILGVLRVDLNGKILAVLLSGEVAVLLILAIAGLGDPASGFPLARLSPGGLFGHAGVGALLVTALLGFVCFEASAVFSEEAKDPRRTVRIATYTSLAVIAAVYTLASWAMSVHYGDDQVAAVAGQQGPGMLFSTADSTMAEVATVLFMTSLFAAMLSFHNLGRGDQLLRPQPEGRERLGAPDRAGSGHPRPAGDGVGRAGQLPTLLRVTPGSTEAWALPGAFATAAVIGILYGLWLRSARPAVYQGIGLDAEMPPAPERPAPHAGPAEPAGT